MKTAEFRRPQTRERTPRQIARSSIKWFFLGIYHGWLEGITREQVRDNINRIANYLREEGSSVPAMLPTIPGAALRLDADKDLRVSELMFCKIITRVWCTHLRSLDPLDSELSGLTDDLVEIVTSVDRLKNENCSDTVLPIAGWFKYRGESESKYEERVSELASVVCDDLEGFFCLSQENVGPLLLKKKEHRMSKHRGKNAFRALHGANKEDFAGCEAGALKGAISQLAEEFDRGKYPIAEFWPWANYDPTSALRLIASAVIFIGDNLNGDHKKSKLPTIVEKFEAENQEARNPEVSTLIKQFRQALKKRGTGIDTSKFGDFAEETRTRIDAANSPTPVKESSKMSKDSASKPDAQAAGESTAEMQSAEPASAPEKTESAAVTPAAPAKEETEAEEETQSGEEQTEEETHEKEAIPSEEDLTEDQEDDDDDNLFDIYDDLNQVPPSDTPDKTNGVTEDEADEVSVGETLLEELLRKVLVYNLRGHTLTSRGDFDAALTQWLKAEQVANEATAFAERHCPTEYNHVKQFSARIRETIVRVQQLQASEQCKQLISSAAEELGKANLALRAGETETAAAKLATARQRANGALDKAREHGLDSGPAEETLRDIKGVDSRLKDAMASAKRPKKTEPKPFSAPPLKTPKYELSEKKVKKKSEDGGNPVVIDESSGDDFELPPVESAATDAFEQPTPTAPPVAAHAATGADEDTDAEDSSEVSAIDVAFAVLLVGAALVASVIGLAIIAAKLFG